MLSRQPRLTGWERFLLFLPIPGAVAFGLGPLLFADTLPRALGFAADDPYILHLAGAGTFAFAIALGLAVVQGDWLAVRFIAVATLVFSALAIPVCALEFGAGPVRPVVYLFIVDSLIQVLALGWLLVRHRDAAGGRPDVATSGVAFTTAATLVATLVGLVALLFAPWAAQLFGYHGTDVLVYRLAGAETLGYAVMGGLMVRSRVWAEMRLPVVLVLGFTGIGLLVTLLSLAQGGPVLLPGIVLLVCIVVTGGGVWTLVRGPARLGAGLATASARRTPA